MALHQHEELVSDLQGRGEHRLGHHDVHQQPLPRTQIAVLGDTVDLEKLPDAADERMSSRLARLLDIWTLRQSRFGSLWWRFSAQQV